MHGVTLRTSSAADAFWRLVDLASEFEKTPSIRPLNYDPHITLSRYPAIEPAALLAARDAFAGEPALSLTFDRIATFDNDTVVFWLAPRNDHRLLDLREKLSPVIDEALCDTHYRPAAWIPHLTIATAVPPSRKLEASRRLERGFEPFTLTFDHIDFLSWPPVSVLGRLALQPA